MFSFFLKFIDLVGVIFLHYLALDAESISRMSSIALQILDVLKNFFLSCGLICCCVFRKKGDTNFVKEDGLRKLILVPEDYLVHTILHSIQVEPLICSVFCHIRKDLYPFIPRQP